MLMNSQKESDELKRVQKNAVEAAHQKYLRAMREEIGNYRSAKVKRARMEYESAVAKKAVEPFRQELLAISDMCNEEWKSSPLSRTISRNTHDFLRYMKEKFGYGA